MLPRRTRGNDFIFQKITETVKICKNLLFTSKNNRKKEKVGKNFLKQQIKVQFRLGIL